MQNNGVKSEILLKTNNSGNYQEKYMKIKFTLDDDLPLNKTLEPYNKYYLQVFLDECLHELYMFT